MEPLGGSHAVSRHLKVLLPSSSSSHKLRISEELAQRLDGDAGAGGTAFVVSPLGKVWRVEVGRDGDGAFLGRGWPEFVAAHGIGAGWFLVLRHEGGGVLTVKAFDTSFCLREFSRALNGAVAAKRSSTGNGSCSRRPQFIKVLLGGSMEKMHIPPNFVREHVAEAGMNCRTAILLSLRCKFWRVEIETDRSGNLFLAGGWLEFLASHGITEGDALVLRYEGCMTFTVKVFGLDGCQKGFRDQDVNELGQGDRSKCTEMKTEQEAVPPSSIGGKRNSTKETSPSVAKKKRTRSSVTPSKKKAAAASKCTYEIGPPSWIKKEINAYALEVHPTLAPTFCKAIGFVRTSDITMRTSTGGGAARSWRVRCYVYSRGWCQLGLGWKSFCRDNGLRVGDVCTFNVLETTLWHVDIARRSSSNLNSDVP